MALGIYRADRRTEFWTDKTPDNIGPGSYIDTMKTDSTRKVTGKSQEKRSISTGANRCSYQTGRRGPGPGTYEVDSEVRKGGSRAGSSCFASRQKRMGPLAPGATVYCYPSSYHNPGPAHYQLPTRTLSPKPIRKSLPLHIAPTTASIPQSRLHRPRDRGPAYYSPTDTVTKGKTQGADFGKAKGRNDLFDTGRNPGPGQYNAVENGEEEVQGQAIFVSKVKRMKESKGETVGPGTYEVLDTTGEVSGQQTGFGSTVERGQTWANDLVTPFTRPERMRVPGVGTYHLAPSRSKTTKRNRVPAPFLSSTTRDCLSSLQPESQLGPGAYDAHPSNPPAKGQFLASEERFVGLFTPKEGPSPGQYYKTDGRSTQQQTCSMRSTAERFRPLASENPMITLVGTHTTPSVGDYHFPYFPSSSSWKSKQPKCTNPPSSLLESNPVIFDSSTHRFPPQEIFPGHRSDVTPGPCDYMYPPTSHKPSAKPVIAHSPRFTSPGDSIYTNKGTTGPDVGPGCYEQYDSLIKPSFNLTLDISRN